jgi:hypothetical protein
MIPVRCSMDLEVHKRRIKRPENPFEEEFHIA